MRNVATTRVWNISASGSIRKASVACMNVLFLKVSGSNTPEALARNRTISGSGVNAAPLIVPTRGCLQSYVRLAVSPCCEEQLQAGPYQHVVRYIRINEYLTS